MAKRVTLKDVAHLAGVSYQTVSKVLHGQIQVTPQTRQRIEQAARSLGYRPSSIARSLRWQRACLIGYSWAPTPPGQFNTILDQFLQSMTQEAEKAGYHILCFPYRPNHDLDTYRELIESHRVDAFVLSSVEHNDPRVAFLKQAGFPFVAFGRTNAVQDFPWVDVDGGGGMARVALHLIERGHRRIGVLAWPPDSRVGQNRLEGLLTALHEQGLELPESLLKRGEGNSAFGQQAAMDLLSLPAGQRPTALVAFNDFMAIGAMEAARQLGLRVGEDLAITGFDDTPLIQYLNPPLTSVRQPIWEVGQHVIRMLIDILENHPLEERQLLLAPELIVRASSDFTL
jgi:DNA-binding LacI/PurR family transcriptional regulator